MTDDERLGAIFRRWLSVNQESTYFELDDRVGRALLVVDGAVSLSDEDAIFVRSLLPVDEP